MMLAKRMEQIKESPIVKIADRVREMEAGGEKIIRLETGEPHFATPAVAKVAVQKALEDNLTHYSHSRGLYELRKMICDKYNREFGAVLEANKNILITPGAKQAIFYAILSVVEKRDEAIILTPGWVSYEEMVKLADGIPVYAVANKDKNFEINCDIIKKKITPRTKVIFLNSPNNPTGRIVSQESLKKIMDICIKKDILLIADEIYNELIFKDNSCQSILSVNPKLTNCILINGFSKTYAMTGWRLGYALARANFIDAMLKLQQNSVTCPATFTQYGAMAVLQKGSSFIKRSLKIYQENKDILVKELGKIDRFRIIEPKGGLYVFIDISKVNKDSRAFSLELLEKCEISVVPGMVFGKGGEGFIRICLATDKKNIIEFVKRLRKFY